MTSTVNVKNTPQISRFWSHFWFSCFYSDTYYPFSYWNQLCFWHQWPLWTSFETMIPLDLWIEYLQTLYTYLPNVLLLVTVPSTPTITTHRTSSPPCNNRDCWYLVFAEATEMVACWHKTNFAALDVSIGKYELFYLQHHAMTKQAYQTFSKLLVTLQKKFSLVEFHIFLQKL